MSLHVVIGGASGFLGTHLGNALRERGHRVTRLVRSPTSEADASTWDPYAGVVDRGLVAGADVVVNLAGAPLIGNVHSQKWAREVRDSRVRTTRLLAEIIAGADRPPAFLAGNGIAIYGDHGSQPLTEESDSRGDALLTEVSREWEDATTAARDAGSRVCVLRTSPVMDRRSPPLKQLITLFKLGLGGRLGNGRQHMAMISLRDWVDAVVHLAEHESASGAFNLCCETTPTNAEFTDTLASAVQRPSFATVPAPLLRVAAGKMAPELLGSLNVRPAALLAAGYRFHDPDVAAVVSAGLAAD
ncbi:Epimerase family protein [Nocardioides dokdonensis FR1436]|uniref:Epimerase family protein n=1 Tax=Nocardioides dokdonensis FR1436 TaxID=1300347 RepID=A0A1A9GLZ1_9ACTN|nr:TIGR01777 family oxidoreductase [Nocardioides dokdonensis]ANH39294.1 Epimerase family protein [Nocardioides dokdonensis FR1436]